MNQCRFQYRFCGACFTVRSWWCNFTDELPSKLAVNRSWDALQEEEKKTSQVSPPIYVYSLR